MTTTQTHSTLRIFSKTRQITYMDQMHQVTMQVATILLNDLPQSINNLLLAEATHLKTDFNNLTEDDHFALTAAFLA